MPLPVTVYVPLAALEKVRRHESGSLRQKIEKMP
jgi:hypothetical protein